MQDYATLLFFINRTVGDDILEFPACSLGETLSKMGH